MDGSYSDRPVAFNAWSTYSCIQSPTIFGQKSHSIHQLLASVMGQWEPSTTSSVKTLHYVFFRVGSLHYRIYFLITFSMPDSHQPRQNGLLWFDYLFLFLFARKSPTFPTKTNVIEKDIVCSACQDFTTSFCWLDLDSVQPGYLPCKALASMSCELYSGLAAYSSSDFKAKRLLIL